MVRLDARTRLQLISNKATTEIGAADASFESPPDVDKKPIVDDMSL
jgi:hypothetical protein